MPHHNQAVGSGPRGPRRRPPAALLGIGLAVALATSACGGGSAPSSSRKPAPAATMPAGPACIQPENGGGCLQLAPGDKRVDLTRPSFSNPTSITNPLHPSSRLAQVIYGGQVDGKPLRTEFTRLPGTKTITWDGQRVETVVLQYLNYLDGRIEEVALDWFAQADDGAVWYFGEDVFNYADGAVADTKGSWIAGKGGPPAMIMPASPKVGNVYRSENIPAVVFEEVTVKTVGQTVQGPSGPVSGALTASELHFDGKREDKVFAPGYGEFSTGDPKGDLELASLAVPTDARPGPLPAKLTALSSAVRAAFDRVGGNDWRGAASPTSSSRRCAGTSTPSPGPSPPAGPPRPARPRCASPRTTSTSNCGIGPSSKSTSPASDCGHASSRSTPPPTTPAPSPATSPPWSGSATGSATPSTRPLPLAWTSSSATCGPRPTTTTFPRRPRPRRRC